MRQAYDYWQDQPGSYRANVRNVRQEPLSARTELDRPGNDFRVRRKQPRLRTAFSTIITTFTFAKVAIIHRDNLTRALPVKEALCKIVSNFPHAGRTPIAGAGHIRTVRSVMYFRQDRQDSRDQQPRRASTRWTALPDSRERRGQAVTQLPLPSAERNRHDPYKERKRGKAASVLFPAVAASSHI